MHHQHDSPYCQICMLQDTEAGSTMFTEHYSLGNFNNCHVLCEGRTKQCVCYRKGLAAVQAYQLE